MIYLFILLLFMYVCIEVFINCQFIIDYDLGNVVGVEMFW